MTSSRLEQHNQAHLPTSRLLDGFFSNNNNSNSAAAAVPSEIITNEEDAITNDDEDLFDNVMSVSMVNLNKRDNAEEVIERELRLEEAREAYRAHITPNARSKMFNGCFKIWKKKDLPPSIANYKCGQVLDVYASFVSDSSNFYVQEVARRKDLEYLEDCIQNFVQILLTNDDLLDDLYVFQEKSVGTDLVLVKCPRDGRWRRALFLDKVFSDDFSNHLASDDDDEQERTSKRSQYDDNGYFSFLLLDWGTEEMVIKTRKQINEDLFIFPMNEKLMIGPFALKCAINESSIKAAGSCLPDSHTSAVNKETRDLFEVEFKQQLDKALLRLRISQNVTINGDQKAMVELFFMPDVAASLIGSQKKLIKLNCVTHILHEIKKRDRKQLDENGNEINDSYQVFSQF
jgi:hypothetical protein